MANLVVMPKLSDTMEEGAVANWLKKEGDNVEEGEDFVEIETDKATMTYQSPAEGVILKIILPPKKTVPLNAPIMVVGKKGEKFDLDELTANAPKKPGGEKAASSKTPPPPPPSQKTQATAVSNVAAAHNPVSAKQTLTDASGRLKSSPLARRVAAEKGVNIRVISGSGPHGRVVLRDVEQAAGSGGGGMHGGASTALPPGQDRAVPLSPMRKTIAKRLLAGKNEAPHFYLTVSADMTAMNQWRAHLNKNVRDGDVKVSVNDLFMYVLSRALRHHPNCNASWQGEEIMEYGSVHLAMAVALPTGLVTPVIRNIDQLGIRDIAQQSKKLAGLAKDGKLQNEDYAGGTFTISNLGMFGIEEFTAIINPPQAGIVAIGATIPTPWVNEHGAVVVQPRVKVTMSCDHRVIDGMTGAQFLQTLVAFIEAPMLMMQ